MKTKIKTLLTLIKENDGRGIATFFKKEKETSLFDDVVKMKLPHNFVYGFYGTIVEKVKEKPKSFILKGAYYEDDNNDGTIKIKVSFTEPSKIFDKLSENKWQVNTILVDKDSIGVIAVDVNGNLISLIEKNKIKKIKEKKMKQILADERIEDDSRLRSSLILKSRNKVDKRKPNRKPKDTVSEKVELHVSYADINKPSLNLQKAKEIVESQEAQKKADEIPKQPRKTAIRRKSTTAINNDNK